jgi:hypothetical protein
VKPEKKTKQRFVIPSPPEGMAELRTKQKANRLAFHARPGNFRVHTGAASGSSGGGVVARRCSDVPPFAVGLSTVAPSARRERSPFLRFSPTEARVNENKTTSTVNAEDAQKPENPTQNKKSSQFLRVQYVQDKKGQKLFPCVRLPPQRKIENIFPCICRAPLLTCSRFMKCCCASVPPSERGANNGVACVP